MSRFIYPSFKAVRVINTWFVVYVLIRPVDRKEFEKRTFPHVYDVIVYKEAGHVYAKDASGNVICADSPTSCLQEAINYVNSGGLIFIKPGVYDIFNTVYIEQQNSNITIMGSGRSTVLKSYKTDDPPYMIRLNLAKGVTLRDFVADGNGIAYVNVRDSLMSFNAPTDLRLINLECFNTNTGACIDIGYANLVYMEGLYLHDNGSIKMSDGIHVGFSKRVYLYNSHISENTDAGIAFDNCEDVVVENNYFFYNGMANIFIWSANSSIPGTLRSLIAGNHIVGKTGIWIGRYQNITTEPDGVNIVGNFIRDTYIGVRIDVGSNVKIVGNLIRGSNTAIKTSGWFVDISDNVITDSQIGIDSQSETTHIRNNIFVVVNTPITGMFRVVDSNMSFYNTPSVLNRNSGQVVILANATSVNVNHDLMCTPKKVLVTPLAQPPGLIWVNNITNTQFTINISTAPSIDLPVAWYAEC